MRVVGGGCDQAQIEAVSHRFHRCPGEAEACCLDAFLAIFDDSYGIAASARAHINLFQQLSCWHPRWT